MQRAANVASFVELTLSPQNQLSRVITVDKYLNSIVERDHRFIKKITNAMMGFKSSRSLL